MSRLPPINRRVFDNSKAAYQPLPEPSTRPRELRRNATTAERRLWYVLRLVRKEERFHFRRQAPIGPYIVDFVCINGKLIVELDGSQHLEPDALAYDARRTWYLESRGFTVLRFPNEAVMQERESVMREILSALKSSRSS